MKKILIIGLGFFAFACGDANTTNEEADTETTTEETLGDGDVEIGSGEEISPQLEGLEDSGRLEVDTVSSPTEINQQQKNDNN